MAGLWIVRRHYPAWPRIDLPVFLSLLYVFVSSGWAVYPWAAYQFAMNILSVALVYALLRSDDAEGGGEKGAGRILAAILISGTFQLALELFQYFTGQSGRPAGSFANPNHLAGFLFFGVAAAVHHGTRGASKEHPALRGICLALAAMMAGGIFLTRSRAMVPVAAGVFIFLIFTARGRERRHYAAAGVAGGALLVAAVVSRFSAALDPYAFSRLNIWKAAWKTALAHPFGVGLGGFKFFWPRFREPIEGATFRYWKAADTAHSQLFGVLSDLGFPGIVLAMAVAGSVLYLALRESRREDRILALCVIPLGAMIHAVFDVNLDIPGIALPVAACVAVLANRNSCGETKAISLFPALRVLVSVVLFVCIGYSAATCLGYARYHSGLESLRKGDTKEAMDGFSSAERFDPLSSAYPDAVSSVYFRWFLQTRRADYLAAAVNAEQRAVAASPEDFLRRSQAGYLLGELAEAVSDREGRGILRALSLYSLDESIRINPYDIVANLRKAEILRRVGKGEEARGTLESLISIEPNAVKAYLALAIMEEAERPLKAAELYRKAIALSRELEGKPIEPSQREFLRIDMPEVERRLKALEKGHFPSRSAGQ